MSGSLDDCMRKTNLPVAENLPIELEISQGPFSGQLLEPCGKAAMLKRRGSENAESFTPHSEEDVVQVRKDILALCSNVYSVMAGHRSFQYLTLSTTKWSSRVATKAAIPVIRKVWNSSRENSHVSAAQVITGRSLCTRFDP